MEVSIPMIQMHFADHLVALIICIIAPALAYSSRSVTSEDIRLEPNEKISLYHSNALLLIVFALVLITLWRLPGRSLESLGLSWPQWNTHVSYLLVGIGFIYAMDIFFQFGRQKWRNKTLANRESALAFVPSDKNEFRHFTFLAFAAGTSEEIIFRGFLLHYLVFWTGNTSEGLWGSCLFASVLFAFLHGYQGMKSALKVFLVSMLLSALFIWSQSLIPVIIVHILIDLVSGWLSATFIQSFHEENTPDQESKGL